MDIKLDLKELIELRHTLHANAEVSNQEEKTAKIIVKFLNKYKADKVWKKVAGFGVVALFKGDEEGPNIGFRADMDALHIAETIDLKYASKTPHVAHKCGHDGHMAMVMGIAAYLSQNKLHRGNVYLVFQPAEETGEGAERISRGLEKLNIQLDYLFGLHNLPGFPVNKVLSTEGTFSAGSRGMVIKLFGKTSHAAEPEFGLSPVIAIAEITTIMTRIHETEKFTDLTLATVIHAELGEITFGTTPGYGEVRITLRAMRDEDMSRLIELAEGLVKKKCEEQQLECDIFYTEIFPATENTQESYEIMKKVAQEVKSDFEHLDKPFKWSEDFGQYKLKMKSGFFGIGSGEDCPHLHDENYDFPDDILINGIKMYVGLLDHFKLI